MQLTINPRHRKVESANGLDLKYHFALSITKSLHNIVISDLELYVYFASTYVYCMIVHSTSQNPMCITNIGILIIIKISLSLDNGHLRPESVLRGDSDEYKLKIQLDVSLKVV